MEVFFRSQCSSTSPVCFEHDGKKLTDPVDICNAFNTHFESNFVPPRDVFSDLSPPARGTGSLLSNVSVNVNQVLQELLKIKLNASPGPDKIPAIVLNRCAASLAPSLCAFFNYSLLCGAVPLDWKHAFVSPIFKSGHMYLISNYRPISLTSLVSKNLEHLLVTEIFTHLKSKFLKRQSTWVFPRPVLCHIINRSY